MKASLIHRLFLMVLSSSAAFASIEAGAAETEIFHPMLVTRTGPFAAAASGVSSGQQDYFALVNATGGIDGVKIRWEECEFGYQTPRALECYERYKKDWKIVYPNSSPVLIALADRAITDKVMIINSAGGRADSTDGKAFPYLSPVVANFWAQASSTVRYIAQLEGGEDKLKGKKLAYIHLDNEYGEQAIPMLEALSKRFGFEFRHFPLPLPALEQSAAWVDIARRMKADWVLQWNYGQSCSVSFTEMKKVGFPVDKFLGSLWCGSEQDVRPAGDLAAGYVSANWHGVGRDCPVIQQIIEKVHKAGKGNIEDSLIGTVAYDRGVIMGIVITEAFRNAIRDEGLPLTGEKVKKGYEKIKLNKARLEALGATGLMPELNFSEEYHGGIDAQVFQKWDGQKWATISGWIPPYEDLVKDEIKKSVAEYQKSGKAKN
jgi:branched-chain amino acid transport system substrate-binding protein